YRAEPDGRGGGLCDAAGAADDPDRKLYQFPWPWRARATDLLGRADFRGGGDDELRHALAACFSAVFLLRHAICLFLCRGWLARRSGPEGSLTWHCWKSVI